MLFARYRLNTCTFHLLWLFPEVYLVIFCGAIIIIRSLPDVNHLDPVVCGQKSEISQRKICTNVLLIFPRGSIIFFKTMRKAQGMRNQLKKNSLANFYTYNMKKKQCDATVAYQTEMCHSVSNSMPLHCSAVKRIQMQYNQMSGCKP